MWVTKVNGCWVKHLVLNFEQFCWEFTVRKDTFWWDNDIILSLVSMILAQNIVIFVHQDKQCPFCLDSRFCVLFYILLQHRNQTPQRAASSHFLSSSNATGSIPANNTTNLVI